MGSAGVIAVTAPPARNHVLSWWYDPSNLPALHENPRVHYEPGAEINARKVAAWLPAAMARIEAAQGRGFGGPVTVGVYATDEAFARANGMGSSKPRGTTVGTRVYLSPRLWSGQADDGDPEKILTHELSHAHLGSNGVLPWVIPTWFWEGLAVTLSNGGGAEGISPDDARAAIAAGRTIVVTESRSLLGGDGQPADRFAPRNVHDYRMIYRQAGIFVADLRARDGHAFAGLLDDLYNGRAFPEAFKARFGESAPAAWERFVTAMRPSRSRTTPSE